ncbi:FAD-dependent monooxygenase [Salinimonas lutimaris]|uniref:FAD-dependent monooxygenase n=1 Tax=Salinimonas lutimaris TaxID=914153 RepID=UPI0010BFEDAB|nr:FAD-dependent monooxygenase [Salinimonas lutimaris]
MYDFCISGGGMIGAATALGLRRQGYQVAVIEASQPRPFTQSDGPDLRVSALSMASVDLLTELGAWQNLPEGRVRQYDSLSVWEAPDTRTDFTAAMANMDILGYFVENRLLQLACLDALAQCNHDIAHSEALPGWFDSTIETLTQHHDHCQIALANGTHLQARWLIGADGANSVVRRLAGIGTSGWQYSQHALGITVETQQPLANWTWQEFHPSGPRAFLPMYDNFGSFVWYDSPEKIKALSKLDNLRLQQAITDAFPAHAGAFKVVGKAAFPLTRMHAQQYLSGRVILVGDAAHTINPLAGQGVNIGFRDVASLLTQCKDASDLSSPAFVRALQHAYERPRRRDNLAMMSAMDGFYLLFSNNLPPVKWVRNRLLGLAQTMTPVRRQVLKYAMGMHQWKF